MSDLQKYILTLVLLLAASVSQAQALSDPTRRPDAPSVFAGASESGWQLQATRISTHARSAVINGQLVREGQRIADARVLRIEHGQVILDVGGRRTTVSMFAPIGKTPVLKQGSQE